MSEQTAEERAVSDAIDAAVKEASPGSIVTGWVLVVEAAVPDDLDATAFVYQAAEGQGTATTIGLLRIGTRYHETRIGDADDE